MSRILKSRRAKVVLGVAAALAITVVAVAYWTSSGSDATTAAAQAGNGTAFAFSDLSSPTGLAPGAGAKDLTGTITNGDTDTSYKLHTVTATISSVDKANGVTGTCDATDYALSNATGSAWAVATDGDSATVTPDVDIAAAGTYSLENLQISFVDKSTNQDACKGATVHVSYAAA